MGQAINSIWQGASRAEGRTRVRPRRKAATGRLFDGVVMSVVLAAVMLGVTVHWRAESRLAAAIAQSQEASNRVEELTREIASREREISLLRGDPVYIESVARSTLGMVRPEEIVLVLEPGSNRTTTADVSNDAESVGPDAAPQGAAGPPPVRASARPAASERISFN